MDLNNHIVKAPDSNPFHSSGFAVSANGNRLGSTANVSFDQLQQIERNRQLVGSYQRSALGASYAAQRTKPVANRVINRSNMPQRPSLQQHNSISLAPRHFSEPTARTYNPYS